MALLVKIEIIDWEKKHANEMTFPFYREGYFGIRKKGVVSLKRGNSFLVQKKHSDYEKPNACGRM